MPNTVDETILNKLVAGLLPPQTKAVLTRSRFSRIVAGAGAGKTKTLTRRIVFLLASGAPAESIVAFAFTEKAAASMKERIADCISVAVPIRNNSTVRVWCQRKCKVSE